MWKVDKGNLSGVTTDTYTDALAWQVSEIGKKTMLLQNIHAGNSLQYRLYGYLADGEIADDLVPETTLSPGSTAEFHYDRQWGKLVLQVKAAVAGSQATYSIEYEGQGA